MPHTTMAAVRVAGAPNFRPPAGKEQAAAPYGGRAGVEDAREDLGVSSPQTLSEAERRIVAVWAADCAERVLGLFEAQAPGDTRPRDAIARARAFGNGELDVAEEIRRRFSGGGAAREVRSAGNSAACPLRPGRLLGSFPQSVMIGPGH